MLRWMREKLARRSPATDPETARRARDDADRDNWKLWKQRIPPTPKK
jgi:hypothetical protein